MSGMYVGNVFVSATQAQDIAKNGGYVGNTYVSPASAPTNGGYIGNSFISSSQGQQMFGKK